MVEELFRARDLLSSALKLDHPGSRASAFAREGLDLTARAKVKGMEPRGCADHTEALLAILRDLALHGVEDHRTVLSPRDLIYSSKGSVAPRKKSWGWGDSSFSE